jgi:hypothetical protein
MGSRDDVLRPEAVRFPGARGSSTCVHAGYGPRSAKDDGAAGHSGGMLGMPDLDTRDISNAAAHGVPLWIGPRAMRYEQGAP